MDLVFYLSFTVLRREISYALRCFRGWRSCINGMRSRHACSPGGKIKTEEEKEEEKKDRGEGNDRFFGSENRFWDRFVEVRKCI